MARTICDRCPNEGDLEHLLDYDLCAACAYDLRQTVKVFVATGRKPEVVLRAGSGERWAQCLKIIEEYGYVDTLLLSRFTGLTRLKANEYLQSQRKRGFLKRAEIRGRFVKTDLAALHAQALTSP